MSVRKCPKCASVWYTELVKCAFCGVEGEEVKGPISPAKLNLAHGSVAPMPPAESKGSEPPSPPPPPAVPAAPTPEPKEAPSDQPAPSQAELPPTSPPPPPVLEVPPPIPRAATGLQPAPAPAPTRISRGESATAPAPRIPSAIAPVIFAGLGVLACAVLPGITVLRHDRVSEILAMLAFAILSPFAPLGWFAGQRYADQCRTLGFVPAPASRSGKILGMLATFLLVFEVSALSIFVVVQGLSGKVICPLWK